MKRLTTRFYQELHALRESFGDSEYDVDDLIEAAVPILEKHLGSDAGRQLEIDMLRGINDRIEAHENDPRQDDFFSHGAHMALGKRRRIKRGRATFDQLLRRGQVIDRNHAAQNSAWAAERLWINDGIAALRHQPPTVVLEDVLNEDGSVKALPPNNEPAGVESEPEPALSSIGDLFEGEPP